MQQPRFQQPQQARQPSARNDIYLPAMPEMLGARTPSSTLASPRYAQKDGNRSARPQQPQSTPVVVRGQSADEPAGRAPSAAQVSLPSPEQLGLIRPKPADGQAESNRRREAANLDWAAARTRLDRLGAVSYRLEKAPEGGFRFACVLPHNQSRTNERHFETRAATEAEAVELALTQAESWAATR